MLFRGCKHTTVFMTPIWEVAVSYHMSGFNYVHTPKLLEGYSTLYMYIPEVPFLPAYVFIKENIYQDINKSL